MKARNAISLESPLNFKNGSIYLRVILFPCQYNSLLAHVKRFARGFWRTWLLWESHRKPLSARGLSENSQSTGTVLLLGRNPTWGCSQHVEEKNKDPQGLWALDSISLKSATPHTLEPSRYQVSQFVKWSSVICRQKHSNSYSFPAHLFMNIHTWKPLI